jgi:hypothetical protein
MESSLPSMAGEVLQRIFNVVKPAPEAPGAMP